MDGLTLSDVELAMCLGVRFPQYLQSVAMTVSVGFEAAAVEHRCA